MISRMTKHIGGVVQNCINYTADALGLLQSCTKPSISYSGAMISIYMYDIEIQHCISWCFNAGTKSHKAWGSHCRETHSDHTIAIIQMSDIFLMTCCLKCRILCYFQIIHRELSAKSVLVGHNYVCKIAGLNPPGHVSMFVLFKFSALCMMKYEGYGA